MAVPKRRAVILALGIAPLRSRAFATVHAFRLCVTTSFKQFGQAGRLGLKGRRWTGALAMCRLCCYTRLYPWRSSGGPPGLAPGLSHCDDLPFKLVQQMPFASSSDHYRAKVASVMVMVPE
jgi:hypothetical protein